MGGDNVQDVQLSMNFRQTANSFYCKYVPNIALFLGGGWRWVGEHFGFGLSSGNAKLGRNTVEGYSALPSAVSALGLHPFRPPSLVGVVDTLGALLTSSELFTFLA